MGAVKNHYWDEINGSRDLDDYDYDLYTEACRQARDQSFETGGVCSVLRTEQGYEVRPDQGDNTRCLASYLNGVEVAIPHKMGTGDLF